MRATGLCVLLLTSLLAGCASDDPAEAPSAAAPTATAALVPALNNTTALPARPIPLELQGCLQLHTFFPYPIAVFSQLGFQLPDGFQFDSSDGATVDVFIAWWFCSGGLLNDTVNAPFAEVGSMFVGMPVLPPADLVARDPRAEDPQLDLLPLTWIISNQLAARFLDDIPGLAGGYVEVGDVTTSTDLEAGVAATRGMTAHASFGTFDVDAAFQAAPSDNPAGRYRMWLVPDEAPVTGYLDIANTAGKTLGSGQADLRFRGDADTGAPPATFGDSHVVDETGVVLVAVGLV